MDFEEFRRHAHTFSDWMADYLASVETYPVRSQVRPGEVLDAIPQACPEGGERMAEIFEDFRKHIVPGMTHWQHPLFFAYFNGNSSPPSVLAEMLTATLGAQCVLWETSPAATEFEQRVMEWLRDLLGLPKTFVGSIQDSGSTSNLLAIIAACEKATNGRFSRDGLAGGPPLVVYASEEAHSSIEKGARIVGLGAANVRKIAVRDDRGMDPHALVEAIRRDRTEGRIPACIVACFGTTGLGSIDALHEIGPVASNEGIYLHVDGAWAGSALILPEVRPQIAGIEYADSFVFNPQKWLFTNFDCSAFYMRDPRALAGALSLTPAYLESSSARTGLDYRDWSIALGRRFRSLKLWFVLRSFGAQAMRDNIRNHIEWAARLAALVREEPDFELTTGPNLALLSFRYSPVWAAGEETTLDVLNAELLERVNNSGRLYLTKTRASGRLVIRFVIGQTYTTWRHVEEGWSSVRTLAHSIPAPPA